MDSGFALEISPSQEATSFRQPLTSQSKSIGFFAGFVLLVNNITGPGVTQLGNMFAEAGWLVPVLILFSVWAATTLTAVIFCKVMRRMPDNDQYQGGYEYTSIVKHWFGRKWYLLSQVGLNGTLQSLNIISVIESTQIMDKALSALFGGTCALNLTPFQLSWMDEDGRSFPVKASDSVLSCVDVSAVERGHAWGCHLVITPGFLLTAAMAIPCGRWNLDENMRLQIVAFFITCGCWIFWVFAAWSYSAQASPDWTMQAVNTDPRTGSQAAVLGTLLFNFGFATTIPSWVNEKKPTVCEKKSLLVSTFMCTLIYLVLGVSGATAYHSHLQGLVTGTCSQRIEDPSYKCRDDVLRVLLDGSLLPPSWEGSAGMAIFTSVSAYIFPIVAVLSSIPVFSIVVKNNTKAHGFSDTTSFLWGVVFPWLVAWPLIYMPNILAQCINLTSLLFVCFTDFIVPLMLYISVLKYDARRGQGGWTAPQEIVMCLCLIVLLTLASVVAFILTIAQTDFDFSSATCAAATA